MVINDSFLPESSGISATDIEPMIVPGMVTIGRAIPVTMPKNETASDEDVPVLINMAGNMIEINKLTTLVPILRIAIGADSEIKGLISFIEGVILLPLTKYMTMAIILERAQAME